MQDARLQLRSPCLFRCYCIAACSEWSYSFAIHTFHCTYEIFYKYAVHKIWLIHSTYFIHPLFLLQSWLYYSFLCICPPMALDLWINICIANLKFYLFVFHISNLLGLIFLQSFITTQTLLQVSNKINCEWNLWS